METHYVYILLCNDGKTYVGCTNDLNRRMLQHEVGEVKTTCQKLPIRLETYIVFKDKYKAYKFEKYLKSGSGRAFMFKRFIEREV